MTKRNGPAPDFSGDFSFLNTSPTPAVEVPNLSEVDAADNADSAPVVNPAEELSASVASAATEPSPVLTTHAPAQHSDNSNSAGKATEAADSGTSVLTRRPRTIAVPTWFPGYTGAITLTFIYLLVTGRIHVSPYHALESLPDLRPLASNEFQPVAEDAALPDGHDLGLGESRRFGDVVVTPVKVSRAPLEFQNFLSGKPEPTLTTTPALKLHLKFENVADDIGFPPFDAGLMSHRIQPEASELSILANSFLSVPPDAQHEFSERLLHYPQTMDSNFVLTGQNAGKVVMPGETLETWVATIPLPEGWSHTGAMRWRVQFRKGINRKSRNGVTTLIDVNFNAADIQG